MSEPVSTNGRIAATREARPLSQRYSSGLGLVWVYSGVLWLYGVYATAQGGYYEATIWIVLRLILTIGVGVGLCGLERWAWAMAVCVAAFYLCAGIVVLTGVSETLIRVAPHALSWQPVYYEFTVLETQRIGAGAGVMVAVALVNLVILWKTQTHFDVPERRPYSVLVQEGIWPSLLIVFLDVYLISGWWRPDGR